MTEFIVKRCPWAQDQDDIVTSYHDHEWCKLDLNEQHLFEMLTLELFQSGLNWSVILHKRDNFRKDFYNFKLQLVAQMTEGDIERLMQDKGIIRNRMKITATITNAKAICKLTETGSFSQYLKDFVGEPIMHHPNKTSDLPSTNQLATKLAKQLKKAGFSFVGPVTIYSFLQSVGLINDHLETCPFKYDK